MKDTMSDLVEMLRALAGRTADVDDHVTIHQAADEIERLRAALQIVLNDKEGDLDFVQFQVRAALPPPPVKAG